MQANPVEIDFSDAVRITEAAACMGRSVESLLREAATDQRVLYVGLAPHSATLTSIPSNDSPKTGSYKTNEPKFVALMARYAKMLILNGSAQIDSWLATHDGGILDWHFWRLDAAHEVTIDNVFVLASEVIAAPLRDDACAQPIAETERNKLLKHIGGLALLLAEKSNLYKNGEAPNALQIATAVTDLLKGVPDANVNGAGVSSIRDSIGDGLKLLNK